MASELLERTAMLRDEAWEAVKASKPYAVFKALDEATVIAGGVSALAVPSSAPARVVKPRRRKASSGQQRSTGGAVRLSYADAAEVALEEAGVPLTLPKLMEKAIEKGAQIGGENRVNNFRSTLSKDARFDSIQKNDKFFWWFKGKPLPPSENEPAELSLGGVSAGSSLRTNQEGGGDYAPTTT